VQSSGYLQKKRRKRMKKLLVHQNEISPQIRFAISIIFGCTLLTLGSLIRVPLNPIPFTLQTLALFILSLTQSPKQAATSSICYLLLATCGLPVLSGVINWTWFVGKSGGYLLAFPLAAYVVAKLRQTIHPLIALLAGQLIIFLLGWVWLALFLGPYPALIKGVLILFPSAIFKGLAAYTLIRRRKR
jgi:biotin transport system substrate-specific component